MRVSCSAPLDTCSQTLYKELEALGVQPIVTNILVRAVYEGDDRYIGEGIVELFSYERDHEITVYYSPEEQNKSARRAMRKRAKAEKNARLHGHPL